MDYLHKIIIDFELHSPAGIRECFMHGVDPNAVVNQQPLVYSLINMYTRGPGFKACMEVFAEMGLLFEDKALLAVLLDDAQTLDALLSKDPSQVTLARTLNCTFTPLYEASLLHICSEYNHLACAKVLMRFGANVNVKAGFDQDGLGGQTPIFHTVNQHDNLCLDMMQFLIAQGADLQLTLKGLVWGKGYEWETLIPAVNPISYAMMGLLPQFQRTENNIYKNVSHLFQAVYKNPIEPRNVPNAYLRNR